MIKEEINRVKSLMGKTCNDYIISEGSTDDNIHEGNLFFTKNTEVDYTKIKGDVYISGRARFQANQLTTIEGDTYHIADGATVQVDKLSSVGGKEV